jgi:hypothetical protein
MSKKTTYRCPTCKAEQKVPADYMGTPRCDKCKKPMKAVKPEPVAGVVDTSTEIKRTNRLYVQLAAIGQCDERDKSVLALGYRGKIIAKPDRPLGIIQAIMQEMLPVMDYSSREAAEKDIAELKEYINGLRFTDDKAGSDQGTGTDLPNGG